MKKNYELIEHTADIGIRVEAGDLKGLFENAALAMFDIIADKKPHDPCLRMGAPSHKPQIKKIIIKQKAQSLDELFVNWLNELLSLSATKELIFSDFEINRLTENVLQAAATGNDVKNYKVNSEIKAATYHELKLEQTASGWQAQVIFDV